MKGEIRHPIQVAGPGELKAWTVHEHELDLLEQGSPASLLLNFALFCIGVTITAFGTIATSPPNHDRTYYSFLIVAIITLLFGIGLLILWFFMHRSTASIINKIKSRMPQNPPTKRVIISAVATEETIETVLRSSEEAEEEEEEDVD
jgi:hypothetical protein